MSKETYVLVLTCATWKHGIGYLAKNNRIVATRQDAIIFTSAERAMDLAKREKLDEAWKVKPVSSLPL